MTEALSQRLYSLWSHDVKYSEYVNKEKVNWWLLRSRLLEGRWCKCAVWLEQSPLQLTLVSDHVNHQSVQTPEWSNTENKWLLSAESYMEHFYQHPHHSRLKEHHENRCGGKVRAGTGGVMMWDSVLCATNVLLPLVNKEASLGLWQGRI